MKVIYWIFDLLASEFGLGCRWCRPLFAQTWCKTSSHYILFTNCPLINDESTRTNFCRLIKNFSLFICYSFRLLLYFLIRHLEFIDVFLLLRQFHWSLRLRSLIMLFGCRHQNAVEIICFVGDWLHLWHLFTDEVPIFLGHILGIQACTRCKFLSY